MGTTLRHRLVNVFTVDGGRLTGNPLCVFEDGSSLSEETMQALARQLNLSETTFVLPPSSAEATARVRIFTPTLEMPFAGHPTLGTAHVVRDLRRAGDVLRLEMKVGLVEVRADGTSWTLRTAQEPRVRPPEATRAELAAMLRLPESALASHPSWVDTGSEQLVVPLTSAEHVRAARPDAALLAGRAFSAKSREAMAYVWAHDGDGEIVARFFFLAHGSLVEDPATGSACANLGGWCIATGAALPFEARVRQGDAVGRPSALYLRVDDRRQVFVRGEVIEIGRGVIEL